MSAVKRPTTQSPDPAPAAAQPEADDASWNAAEGATSPARDLQRELQAAFVHEVMLPELPVSFGERVLRGISRAAGYVALAGTVALIVWLVI